MFGRKSSSGGKKAPVPEQAAEDYSYRPSPEQVQVEPLAQTPSQEQKELLLNAQGAVMDNQNRELTKRLAEMKSKRADIDSTIEKEEAEMCQYDEQQQLLQARLDDVKDSLARKRALVQEYNKIIEDTETAYSKLLESSMSLLSVLEKETLGIHKDRSRHVSISGEADIV